MPWLDCHDLTSALASLAYTIRTTPDDLAHTLREYDEERFESAEEDPWQQMPREVLEHFGTDIATVTTKLDGAHYFHGTRAVDPTAFSRRGILPLNQMVDELWAVLREFANEVSDAQWASFRRQLDAGGGGHDGFLYRLKTCDPIHFGPFGLVVQETFFNTKSTSSHDYLLCPEIIQDIASSFTRAHGGHLEQRYCSAAKPCIVKFRSRQLQQGTVNAALWYVYDKLNAGEVTTSSNYSFDGEGEPISAFDILDVRVVSA